MKLTHAGIAGMVLLTMFLSQDVNAQFSIDAQIRNRLEVRDGYKSLALEGTVPAVFVSQRTRLNINYENENLKIRIAPQDVRLWGDQAIMSSGIGDNPSLDLHEAYADIKLCSSARVKVGRQELAYDNQRLLGTRNWNQNGISYDALVLKMKLDQLNIHAGASWNTRSEASFGNLYPTSRIKSLNFLWFNRKFNDHFKLSLMHISAGITKTDTTDAMNFRHTTGIFSELKKEGLTFWGNFYFQYGKNQKSNDLSAMLLDAEVNYKAGKLTPGLGYSYLSGNDKIIAPGETDRLFDPLYGNRHGFNGLMDYFTSYAKQTNQGGLSNAYLYIDYQFNKKLSARNTLHLFSLAQANPATLDEKALGMENDLVIRYKFTDWGNLEAGYCFYDPTETLKGIQDVVNEKFSQFFYLQLTLTPSLFRQ